MGALKPKGIQNMKRHSSIIYIVGLAFAAGSSPGAQPNQATAPIPANSGHVIVNSGREFWVRIWALSCPSMARTWEALARAEAKTGGLPAGQHVITARADPHQPGASSGEKDRAGK